MPTKILVATPDPAFGEWLQASLVENGGYDVHLVQTGSEVLHLAAGQEFAVAILDSDLPGEPFVPLARALVSRQPGLRLLVIPPENDPHHPNLAGLIPQGYLFRPFYLPGLLDTLHSLLAASNYRAAGLEALPVQVDSPAHTWLEEPDQAARELGRLLLETGAQTALIAAEGRLWACAGQVCHTAAHEAAALLADCWKNGFPGDLARFVRLEAGGSEHLLYAVPLLDELALALLFEPSTPLTRAHREAARLARALTAATAEQVLPVRPTAPPPAPETGAEPEPVEFSESAALAGWLPESAVAETPPGEAEAIASALPEDETPPSTEEWSSADLRAALAVPAQPPAAETVPAEEDLDEYPEEEPVIDLSSVLAGMPSPDPGGEPVFPAAEWVPEDEGEAPPEPPADQAVEARLDALSTPPTVVEEEPAGVTPETLAAEEPAAAPEPEILPAEEPAAVLPEAPADEIPAWLAEPPASETTPLHIEPPARADSGKTVRIQPRAPRDPVPARPEDGALPPSRERAPRALPVTAGTNYTCILIPERPDHYLTGDLASRLDVWVPQLCLAFGWHLSGLVVRPGYLQWTVALDPNVSPGNVVRVIRQRTSERVFSLFPALRYGLARNDFWAPGYLAVRGSRPPAASLLEGFIRQTRARQRY